MDSRRHLPRSRPGSRSGATVVLALAAASLVSLGACYPGSVTDPGKEDVILTVFDTEADFSVVGTYFMPDTILREYDGDRPPDVDDTVREFDEAILAEVEQQFSALGYRRVEDPAEGGPDVVVLLSVNTTDQIEWVPGCWYCGWSWVRWLPDWGWSWGPGYRPGYPFLGPGLGIRTTGTLLVAMLDPVAPGTTIPVWWTGVANGLLARDSGTDLARAQQAIGQMFVQSPYLAEGGEG